MNPWQAAASGYERGLGRLQDIEMQGLQQQAEFPRTLADMFMQGYQRKRQERMQEEDLRLRQANMDRQFGVLSLQQQNELRKEQRDVMQDRAKAQKELGDAQLEMQRFYKPDNRGGWKARLKGILMQQGASDQEADAQSDALLPGLTPGMSAPVMGELHRQQVIPELGDGSPTPMTVETNEQIQLEPQTPTLDDRYLGTELRRAGAAEQTAGAAGVRAGAAAARVPSQNELDAARANWANARTLAIPRDQAMREEMFRARIAKLRGGGGGSGAGADKLLTKLLMASADKKISARDRAIAAAQKFNTSADVQMGLAKPVEIPSEWGTEEDLTDLMAMAQTFSSLGKGAARDVSGVSAKPQTPAKTPDSPGGVRVKSPDGRVGVIPASQLAAAKAKGFVEVQ